MQAFRVYLFFLLSILSANGLRGQAGPAPAGHSAAAQATVFAPGVISRGKNFGLTLTPDRQHACFVHASPARDTLVLYQSHRVGGRWQPAAVLPFSGGRARDLDPFVTPDGKQLIFNSTRHPQDSARTDIDVWAADLKRDGTAAGAPYPLGGAAVNSPDADFYATQARNGNLYFASNRPGGAGKNDLYVARRRPDGTYAPAVNLGAPLNTAETDSNPYVAPDESYLLFFAARPGGFGDVDLYVSRRGPGGRWGEPENLGPEVNTPDGEFCPFVDQRTQTLYFARSARQNGKIVREDIYSIPLRKLKIKL